MEFQFYKDRIEQAPKYGFAAGHDIIKTVCRCAFNDSALTDTEFDTIINLCVRTHIKMMEDNYNAGWNE